MTPGLNNSLETLFREIKLEATKSLTLITALKENTHAHKQLSQKIKNWQLRLNIINRNIQSYAASQEGRTNRIHSVDRNFRYSEKQSINSHFANIDQLKREFEKTQNLLEELIYKSITPSTLETLSNAISQLKSIKDYNSKITQLKNIISRPEIRADSISKPPSTKPGEFPVQDMILMLTMLLLLLQYFHKKNTIEKI